MFDALNEQSLRRPGFRPGRAIVLHDGQGWEFPIPIVVGSGKYAVIEDGKVRWSVRPVMEDGFNRHVDAVFFAATEEENLTAAFSGASELLMENYDLRPRDLVRLLQMDESDRNFTMWSQILETIVGYGGPKHLPVGEPPPSSPTGSDPTSPMTSRSMSA